MNGKPNLLKKKAKPKKPPAKETIAPEEESIEIHIAVHPNGLIAMQFSHALKCYFLNKGQAIAIAVALLNHAEQARMEELT